MVDVGQSWTDLLRKDESDYFALDLSGALMSFFVVNPVGSDDRNCRLYSAMRGEGGGPMSALYGAASANMADLFTPGVDSLPPVVESQMWDNLIRFANTAKAVFGSKRLILIRNDVHLFWWNGRRVSARQRGAALLRARRFLHSVEACFCHETACIEIRLGERWLPDRDRAVWDTAISDDYSYCLQNELGRCVTVGELSSCADSRTTYRRDAEAIYLSAQSEALCECELGELGNADIPWGGGAVETSSVEDIFAVAASVGDRLSESGHSEELALTLADGLRIGACDAAGSALACRNLELLTEYEFSHIPAERLNAARQSLLQQSVLWLDGKTLLKVSLDSSSLTMRCVDLCHAGFSWGEVVASGYVFGLDALVGVLGSWPLYLQRARQSESAPLELCLKDDDELATVLGGLDWDEILACENVVVSIGGFPEDSSYVTKWEAKTDLRACFQDGAFLICLRSGLGDQWYYYALSAVLRSANPSVQRHAILDDLLYDDDPFVLAAPSVYAKRLGFVPDQPYTPRMSELVSPRLRWARRQLRRNRLRDDRSEYFSLGLAESVLVTQPWRMNFLSRRNVTISGKSLIFNELDKLVEWFASDWTYLPVIDILPSVLPGFSQIVLGYKDVFEDATKPAMEAIPAEARDVAALMDSCHSVVLHVRRGDFAALGRAADPAKYRESLTTIVSDFEVSGRGDMRLFVFSDDMAYVHVHEHELGISQFSADRVHYVSGGGDPMTEWNLIRLGEIIITSNSGFVTTAALSSQRVQAMYGFSRILGGKTWQRILGGKTWHGKTWHRAA